MDKIISSLPMLFIYMYIYYYRFQNSNYYFTFQDPFHWVKFSKSYHGKVIYAISLQSVSYFQEFCIISSIYAICLQSVFYIEEVCIVFRGEFGIIPCHTEYTVYRTKSFGTPNILPLPYQNFWYTEFGIPKNWYGTVRYITKN